MALKPPSPSQSLSSAGRGDHSRRPVRRLQKRRKGLRGEWVLGFRGRWGFVGRLFVEQSNLQRGAVLRAYHGGPTAVIQGMAFIPPPQTDSLQLRAAAYVGLYISSSYTPSPEATHKSLGEGSYPPKARLFSWHEVKTQVGTKSGKKNRRYRSR